MGGQPLENVPVDLFPVDLVENFMPAQRVNVHGNIRLPRLAESVCRLTDALAVVAHTVVPARNEEHGQILAHGGTAVRRAGLPSRRGGGPARDVPAGRRGEAG